MQQRSSPTPPEVLDEGLAQQHPGEPPTARRGQHTDVADVAAPLVLDERVVAEQHGGGLAVDVGDAQLRPVVRGRGLDALAPFFVRPGCEPEVTGERRVQHRMALAAERVVAGTGPHHDAIRDVRRGWCVVVVDAHPMKRCCRLEAERRRQGALRLVGTVDTDVDLDLLVLRRRRDLAGPRQRLVEQPCRRRVIERDDIDADDVAVVVATRPAEAPQLTALVGNEPAVDGGVETGLGQVVTRVVEREVGEADDVAVPRRDQREDRLGVFERRAPPRISTREIVIHAQARSAAAGEVLRVAVGELAQLGIGLEQRLELLPRLLALGREVLGRPVALVRAGSP